ncbi:MAG: twin-arginine translocase TatA/TatE family subunit [Candidatus Omnitrophica bacterium]|nr:twin-arginine translocase TatA/TatE family subunit [Candidatus Omnitrophota bacterium]
MLGFNELLVILLIVLLLVGAKRLPDIGRSLGQSIREFQKALKGKSSEQDKDESATKP